MDWLILTLSSFSALGSKTAPRSLRHTLRAHKRSDLCHDLYLLLPLFLLLTAATQKNITRRLYGAGSVEVRRWLAMGVFNIFATPPAGEAGRVGLVLQNLRIWSSGRHRPFRRPVPICPESTSFWKTLEKHKKIRQWQALGHPEISNLYKKESLKTPVKVSSGMVLCAVYEKLKKNMIRDTLQTWNIEYYTRGVVNITVRADLRKCF